MLAVFGGPLGKGEAGREAERPAAVRGCVSPGGAAGERGHHRSTGAVLCPSSAPLETTAGGKEPSVSQQSSLGCELVLV